ncbi:hypothetical protein DAPPUDRAFT_308717 [Daphnia pulex]|uniref:Uncharacterized protein n=1 Tax=Daphnia pulex TaxID=6669 RepID=E9HZ05_DAPPU|nr:hypothetical protein DAPPUDRAFT_308717 [Daphnia pulex]|eukprot:EFX63026.1 hypothetical protein DAPPUDRAFT_308717 [Daphnia pulex]
MVTDRRPYTRLFLCRVLQLFFTNQSLNPSNLNNNNNPNSSSPNKPSSPNSHSKSLSLHHRLPNRVKVLDHHGGQGQVPCVFLTPILIGISSPVRKCWSVRQSWLLQPLLRLQIRFWLSDFDHLPPPLLDRMTCLCKCIVQNYGSKVGCVRQ